MARGTTVVACTMRLAKQERLQNLEATKEAYRAKAREADEARRLADAGEGHYRREYLLREECVLIARELNEVMNVLPGLLLNGCQDQALKAAWRHSSVIRTAKTTANTKAQSELDEAKRLLRNVESDLDRFFGDGWKKVTGVDEIWKPVLTRKFDQNMFDDLERAAVTLQHSLKIAQRVYDEAAAELEEAKSNTEAARQALIWSPI